MSDATLYRPLTEVVDEAHQVMMLRAEYPEIGGVKTGIAALDHEATEAFTPGSLIVVAGESGKGKTALAAQMVAAFGAQVPTLWMTLEDEARDAVTRMLANVGRIDVGKVRSGKAVTGHGDKLDQAAAHLDELDVQVLDGMAVTAEGIAALCWEWQKGREGGVVVIDQLSHLSHSTDRDPDVWAKRGLAPPPSPGAPETAVLEWQAAVMKEVAKRLGITVVLLHQVNEEHSRGAEPTERSIRGSRGIVHKADLVMIPWIPEQVDNPFSGPGTADTTPNEDGTGFLIAVKARRTGRFRVPVRWDGPHQRWCDVSESPNAAYTPPDAPTERQKEGSRALAELRARLDADRNRRIEAATKPAVETGDSNPADSCDKEWDA